jgi:AbrB family looped-hinge helix DNA binding protein
MKEPFIVSIDEAGQITLPLEIRESAHLAPGTQLTVSLREGRIEIEPAPRAVRIEPRGRVFVAFPLDEGGEKLRERQVEETLDEVRSRR